MQLMPVDLPPDDELGDGFGNDGKDDDEAAHQDGDDEDQGALTKPSLKAPHATLLDTPTPTFSHVCCSRSLLRIFFFFNIKNLTTSFLGRFQEAIAKFLSARFGDRVKSKWEKRIAGSGVIPLSSLAGCDQSSC